MPSGTATPPRDETHALQSLVSRLRRALGDGDAILPSADGYRLQIEPDDVDAGRFERLAGEGRAHLRDGDPQRARRVLAEALALWRDVPADRSERARRSPPSRRG